MSLPLIEDLTVTAIEVPIEPAHRTASAVITHSPLLLIDLHLCGALRGHAIVFTYSPAVLKPMGELLLNLKPLLVGQALAPRTLHQSLNARFRLLGTQGLMGMLLAGIDMALWDALARHQSQPLNALLGGTPSTVTPYGGTGYDGEIETARQTEQWVKRGFKGVKAKIGYPTLDEDLKVVRAMRKAAGPDIALMVDYNQSLSPSEAVHRIRELDAEGLAWVEEPVLAHDYANTARVRQAVTTPIQSGENWWGPGDMQHALEADASDLVMPDVMKIGGVTGWLDAVSLAEARGKSVSSHLWPEVSAQLLSIGRTSHWLEYIDWWAPVLQSPLQVENGQVAFDTSRVGSGVEWNATAVERFRT